MLKRNWFLCLIGIHTHGIRTGGCFYNISICKWCKKDVLFVWKEAASTTTAITTATERVLSFELPLKLERK